jgi:putative ABC transport system ATP-binding protein
MDKGIFQFIWRNSRGQQILLMVMTACSFPFLLMQLKLPKLIVNDAIDGKNFPRDVVGFDFGQIEYLLLLCAGFFFLILVNITFSRTINTYKGVSSERMLRRLRYQLYERVLRFPQRHFQKITPSELASMITAEVEPLGFFIGESFATPMVQGGTMATILFFMISENPLLGLVALSMVPLQAWIIPKYQKKITLLGKERVAKSRQLAGKVGESCAGIADVHAHDVSGYMRADVSRRLGEIFTIRFNLYQKKFFMKGLNNFLSQMTPLIFYSVGGVLIINGDLSLGALVAVLAAYARFTTPWRELLKYYERYQDTRIKYEQLAEQFQPGEMMDPALQQQRPEIIPALKDPVKFKNVSLIEDGTKVLDGITFQIEAGERIAIVTDSAARDKIAHLLARFIKPTSGAIEIGEHDYSALPQAITGSAIGYAGPESYVFDGTVEDNLLYGLKHAPVGDGEARDNPIYDVKEAILAGNSTDDPAADWIDCRALGFDDKQQLREWLIKIIYGVELDGSLVARFLNMEFNPANNPELAEKLLQARRDITAKIHGNAEYAALVYPFKDDAYNANASVAENLIFGAPVGDRFAFKTLGAEPYVRSVLEECALTDQFLDIGHKAAATLIDMFGDLSPDQPLFEQFSFVDEETLQKLKNLVIRVEREGLGGLDADSKAILISLTFQLVVDRHRLGLIDESVQAKVLEARKAFREGLPDDARDKLAFFGQDHLSPQLNIRCNLLMGRVNDTLSQAEEKLNDLVIEALQSLNLMEDAIYFATGAPVGIGGSRLSQVDRQKIILARNIIKRPNIFVFNEALSALDREAQERIRGKALELLADTTFIAIAGEKPAGTAFNRIITIRNGRLADQQAAPAAAEEAAGANLNSEAAVLANIPIFAGIEPNHLKLLAFSSQRITFAPKHELIRQGQPGEAAFVILEGEVDIFLGEDGREAVIAKKGKDTLLGELSLLSGTTATATVRAATEVTALKIKKEVFLELIEGDAVVAAHVARVISDKLVQSLQLLAKAA